MYPIEALKADLGNIPHTTDPMVLRRKSRDHFVISPLLRSDLAGNIADIVVSPRSKVEVIAAVAACVRHRIPITPRGGGTANYGQSVPLKGGAVLDMMDYSGIVSVAPGVVRALGGTLVLDMENAAKEMGWELRIMPSTIATSTIAGFVAGGSGGIGSSMWGMLRDRGNITAIEVISAEEEPRLFELTGDDVELVHHAYGANAIITEVAMPTAPAWPWREVLLAFDDFMDAVKFGVRFTRETGLLKKVISVHEWPIPKLMKDLGGIIPDGKAMVNTYVSQTCFPSFEALVNEFGGSIASNVAQGENPFGAPQYEFVYGHGLRQLQKTEPLFTGFQGMYRGENMFDAIELIRREAGPEQPFRLEVFWSEGDVVAMGSPVVKFRDSAQMAAMVELIQVSGGAVANSHTTGVKEVGIKRLTPRDVVFKREMDPHGLLNPGKLNLDGVASTNLPTTGWAFRARA